jgi:glycosyltransferase involved in cell wall biosynthesis
MKMPLISVIINCHNGEKFITSAINSVLSQTYSNWEIIFWDNQSSDNTAEIVNSIKDSRILYFKSDFFTNLYTARNLALNYINGEFVTFLDVDDWWAIDKLFIQLNEFQKDNSVDILYSNYYFVTDNDMKIVHKGSKPSGQIFRELLKDNFIGVSTLMVKSKVFKEIKFKNEYHIIGDYDFTIRASKKFNFKYIKTPLLYYRWHGTNESIKKESLKIEELTNLHKELISNNENLEFYKEINKMYKNINYYTYLYHIKYNKIKILKILFLNITILQKIKLFYFYLKKISE